MRYFKSKLWVEASGEERYLLSIDGAGRVRAQSLDGADETVREFAESLVEVGDFVRAAEMLKAEGYEDLIGFPLRALFQSKIENFFVDLEVLDGEDE